MKRICFLLFGVALLTLTSCQPKKVAVAHTPYRTIVTYDITFDVNKADIKEESMAEINRIKTLMEQNPELRYEVQGHTDSTGSPEANQRLSEKRAEAIVSKLVELGVDASRLTAVGKGQYSPVADNATEEGRAQNRRVVFVAK
jgi:outer membrane protein OmpA-like peptidoglycan-associated protein